MTTYQEYRFCKNCNAVQPATKRKINHLLHFLLCVPTLGFWGWVWLVLVIRESVNESPFHCVKCNNITDKM